jgi:hypothetical protein
MSYATFIPTIASSVLPRATSRMRKCPILAKNSAFHENIAVRNGQNRHQRLHLWPKVLLNCSDMSYATFIPTIVSSVLPLAASRTPRMRKSSNFDRKPAFDEKIAVRNGSKQPERLHLWSKMLVNCSDVFYATFICTIVYSVLPLAASMSLKAKFWVLVGGLWPAEVDRRFAPERKFAPPGRFAQRRRFAPPRRAP